jgi:hypothetical protein
MWTVMFDAWKVLRHPTDLEGPFLWSEDPADAVTFRTYALAATFAEHADQKIGPKSNRGFRVEPYPAGEALPVLPRGDRVGPDVYRLTHRSGPRHYVDRAYEVLAGLPELVVEVVSDDSRSPFWTLLVGARVDHTSIIRAAIKPWFPVVQQLHVYTPSMATDPATDPGDLARCALLWPDAVLSNPVLNMTSLASPDDWVRITEWSKMMRTWRTPITLNSPRTR